MTEQKFVVYVLIGAVLYYGGKALLEAWAYGLL
jgi:hypothetical protein